MPKPKSSKKATTVHSKSDRPVLYDTPRVDLCAGETAITEEYARELLGWVEETPDTKFGGDHLLLDEMGTKIRCTNNITNRPLYAENYRGLRQELLNKRWRLNGETIIIGVTGLILNGQHQLVALVLAEQVRNGDSAEHWKELHGDNPITMDKAVFFGISEDDDVVNTMDTCKPRSLADVIYRSELFATMKASDRRQVSRNMDGAIRLLWLRTGAGLDAYSPKRTHSEALNFITRHPKLLESVKHIFEENKDGGITDKLRLSAGTASGLLYLMGSSSEASNVDEYREATVPSEQSLSWDLWHKACDFWTELARKSNTMVAVRKALGQLQNGGTTSERLAILAKAWDCFVQDQKITEGLLKLSYTTDPSDGSSTLDECPAFGGVDLGNPKETEALDPPPPTEEEIQARTNEINKRRGRPVVEAAATPPASKPVQKPRPTPKAAPSRK